MHLLQKVLRKTYLSLLNYFGFVLAHLILSLQKKKKVEFMCSAADWCLVINAALSKSQEWDEG